MAPTNAQLRRQFPELVPNPAVPRCSYGTARGVVFAAGGPITAGRITLRVHPDTRQAFRALAAVFLSYGYTFDELAGGTLACRHIGGTTTPSLHAYGLALDINPSRNGYRRAVGHLDEPDTGHIEGLLQWGRYTDLPPELVRAVEAIRTADGTRVFKWGGRWLNIKDPMHFELATSRRSLATGINLATVRGWARYLAFEKTDQPPTPTPEDQVLDRNSPRPSLAVADLQAALIRLGFDLGTFEPITPAHPKGADGYFGDSTEAALEAFQTSRGLTVTGVGDGLTVALVFALAGNQGGSADLSKFATKSDLGAHANTGTAHRHTHDEGQTGPPSA